MSIALAARPSETLPGGTLRVTHGVHRSSHLVTADGEVDARTARSLVDVVTDVAHADGTLIVDLGGLAFFGTEGLWALNRIRATCAKHHVPVAIVAGAEVRRVLRVCDPYGAFGVFAGVDDAAVALSGPSSRSMAPSR